MPISPDDPRLAKVAYAKIEGEGIDVAVRKFEVVIGRNSKSTTLDVILGDNMNISRWGGGRNKSRAGTDAGRCDRAMQTLRGRDQAPREPDNGSNRGQEAALEQPMCVLPSACIHASTRPPCMSSAVTVPSTRIRLAGSTPRFASTLRPSALS
jgi:hypothetical protein